MVVGVVVPFFGVPLDIRVEDPPELCCGFRLPSNNSYYMHGSPCEDLDEVVVEVFFVVEERRNEPVGVAIVVSGTEDVDDGNGELVDAWLPLLQCHRTLG